MKRLCVLAAVLAAGVSVAHADFYCQPNTCPADLVARQARVTSDACYLTQIQVSNKVSISLADTVSVQQACLNAMAWQQAAAGHPVDTTGWLPQDNTTKSWSLSQN